MDFLWDDLRYFLAFARTGSMQAAARALGVNQSTVQRRISVLEDRSGRRLLERQFSGYRLTDLGRELQANVEEVEAAVMAVERRLAASGQELTGVVRVTCGSNLASLLRRTPLIDAFHAQYPGLRLQLVISDRFLDLSKGEADVAIRRGEPSDNALVARKLADASWSVYASYAYVEKYGRPAPDDMGSHFVVGCDGAIVNYPGARWARSVAPPASVATRSDNWQGLMLAVKAGAGLAAMPRWQGENEQQLVRVIDDIGLTVPYFLVMHGDMRHTPRVRAIADFVAENLSAFRALLSGQR